MNLAPEILRVLLHAEDAITKFDIIERIPDLDDVKPLDAQHLVGDALAKMIDAGQCERIWGEGRCTYVIAPNPPAMESVGAYPGIEIGATRHSGDPLPEPIAASVPSPPANQAAIIMPKSSSDIELKIIEALSIGTLSTTELAAAMPRVADYDRKKQLKQLIAAGRVAVHGSSRWVRYSLPGVDASNPKTPAPKPAKSAASASMKPQSALANESPGLAIASAPAAADPPSPLSIIDLRAAASDVLKSHGANPLPRSLHRLVIAALGAPESLGA